MQYTNGRCSNSITYEYCNGSSYFNAALISTSLKPVGKIESLQGGQRGLCTYHQIRVCNSGGGGYAGNGGQVKVSEKAQINAYNGSYITDATDDIMTNTWKEENPCIIYIQNGTPQTISIDTVREVCSVVFNKIINKLQLRGFTYQASTSLNDSRTYLITADMRGVDYSATSYGQGIGSGAGWVEVTNGTYTVDSSMN